MQKKLDVEKLVIFMTWLIKKLKENLRPIFQQINIKKYKKHGLEIIDGEKFAYAHEGIIIPVIMHCGTPESCNFKRNLGFKLHDVINCKKQC